MHFHNMPIEVSGRWRLTVTHGNRGLGKRRARTAEEKHVKYEVKKMCLCSSEKKYLHFTTGWREMQALKQTFLTERIILLHITYSRRVFDGHFWVSTINNINLVEIWKGKKAWRPAEKCNFTKCKLSEQLSRSRHDTAQCFT